VVQTSGHPFSDRIAGTSRPRASGARAPRAPRSETTPRPRCRGAAGSHVRERARVATHRL